MNSYRKRIFSGFVRPIAIVLLLNLVAMILYEILEIVAPEYVYTPMKNMVRYALVSVLWVYFIMRALWYASERKRRKLDSERSNLSDLKQAQTNLNGVREHIRSRKSKEF
jgi:hypothetical protein